MSRVHVAPYITIARKKLWTADFNTGAETPGFCISMSRLHLEKFDHVFLKNRRSDTRGQESQRFLFDLSIPGHLSILIAMDSYSGSSDRFQDS